MKEFLDLLFCLKSIAVACPSCIYRNDRIFYPIMCLEMKYNPIWRVEIYVKDMNRAKKFYANVFQKGDWIDLSSDWIEMFGFPRTDELPGSAVALTKMEGWGPTEWGTIVYFGSKDASIEESRVVENGGKIHEAKKSIWEFGFISMIKDSEWNMIGIHSPK